jgi:hypothetical protein
MRNKEKKRKGEHTLAPALAPAFLWGEGCGGGSFFRLFYYLELAYAREKEEKDRDDERKGKHALAPGAPIRIS